MAGAHKDVRSKSGVKRITPSMIQPMIPDCDGTRITRPRLRP